MPGDTMAAKIVGTAAVPELVANVVEATIMTDNAGSGELRWPRRLWFVRYHLTP
jgi:hypothetical protein